VRVADLIDPMARMRLERTVSEAEATGGGEIAIAVVRASDAYARTGWRFGLLLAGLAYLGLGLFAAPLPFWAYLASEAAALALGHTLASPDAVRRRLLARPLVDQRVDRRARRSFAEAGLARAAGRRGILIFVTLLERRVVVLADEGADRALGPGESWSNVVGLVVGGLRSGRGLEGLEGAVRRCGEILAGRQPGDELAFPRASAVVTEV
jgi:putative membrane protein